MAEQEISEKKPMHETQSSTEVALTAPEAEQESGGLEAVDLATPITEKPTSRPRSRVRFEEDENAPVKPPRPMSPHQQAEVTLIEAFPSIDVKVVKAVLMASGGQLEPAFNALLGMSDPDFVEEQPPRQPPRPTPEQMQLHQDEMYARKLAEQYGARADRRARQPSNQPQQRQNPQQRRQSGPPQGEDDKEYSFFDDELPEIRENLRQGFMQTQTTVNKWISNFSKRLNGEDDEDGDTPVVGAGQGTTGQQRQNFGSSTAEQLRGIRKNAERDRVRRSTDVDRYDADPRVLTGDFADLELKDETPPRKPARPLANPDLFKPTPPPPQSGPVDEVDAFYRSGSQSANASPAINRQLSPSPASKSKKWQPLTSVAPAPFENEDEGDDPFSLGDSDDEKELERMKSVDVNEEATNRLKRAASVATEGKGKGKDVARAELEGNEKSGDGLRDQTVDDLMKG